MVKKPKRWKQAKGTPDFVFWEKVGLEFRE